MNLKRFGGILISLFLLTSLNSCYLGNGEGIGNGRIIHETRDVHNYNGLELSSGIELQLTMGNSEKVEIEADEEIMGKVFTEVHNGVLEIGVHNKAWSWNNGHHNIKAFVSARELNRIHTSSGSSLIGHNTLSGSHLDLSTSSGSSMKLKIEESEIIANASSGSKMELEGRTNLEDLSSSSGSSLLSENLMSRKAQANASSGASIHLRVQEVLDAKASSGGSVLYAGNPNQVNKDKSSGGSIEKE